MLWPNSAFAAWILSSKHVKTLIYHNMVDEGFSNVCKMIQFHYLLVVDNKGFEYDGLGHNQFNILGGTTF